MRTWLLVAAIGLIACGHPVPRGAFGVRWGEDADAAAARIGLSCPTWTPSYIGPEFETCSAKQTVWARDGYLTLVRDAGGVAGVTVQWICQYDRRELAAQVRREFSLGDGDDAPFVGFSGGELVKLEHDQRDHSCLLVVGGPHFGKAYEAHGFGQALGNVFTGD